MAKLKIVDPNGNWEIVGDTLRISGYGSFGRCDDFIYREGYLSIAAFRGVLAEFRDAAHEGEEPALTPKNGSDAAYNRQRAEYVRQARDAWREATGIGQPQRKRRSLTGTPNYKDWPGVAHDDHHGPVQALGRLSTFASNL